MLYSSLASSFLFSVIASGGLDSGVFGPSRHIDESFNESCGELEFSSCLADLLPVITFAVLLLFMLFGRDVGYIGTTLE